MPTGNANRQQLRKHQRPNDTHQVRSSQPCSVPRGKPQYPVEENPLPIDQEEAWAYIPGIQLSIRHSFNGLEDNDYDELIAPSSQFLQKSKGVLVLKCQITAAGLAFLIPAGICY